MLQGNKAPGNGIGEPKINKHACPLGGGSGARLTVISNTKIWDYIKEWVCAVQFYAFVLQRIIEFVHAWHFKQQQQQTIPISVDFGQAKSVRKLQENSLIVSSKLALSKTYFDVQ